MINWEKELEKIFNDPLLADVTAPPKKTTSSDRLIAGFQRIVEFVETHRHLPQSNSPDKDEHVLYNYLKGIMSDSMKKSRCMPYDSLGILNTAAGVVSEPQGIYVSKTETQDKQLDEIFNDPLLADEDASVNSIFDLPEYMKKKLEERREADYVAQRIKCKDFELYETGFKNVHSGLKSGKYRLVKFKEAHILQGRYFIDGGMLVYIAGLEQIEKDRHGKRNCRTRCIYENGMESDIYMQTLCKNLYSSGYSIQNVSGTEKDYLEKKFSISAGDVESGMIYVLKSLSNNSDIASIPNLYKIGFTTVPLKNRIANAKNDPTYLCADVEVVATWKVYNIKSSTFESLIHKLFSGVQLQVRVDGKVPKEWFVVPFHIIEQAIVYLINGKSIAYDAQLQQLVCLSE